MRSIFFLFQFFTFFSISINAQNLLVGGIISGLGQEKPSSMTCDASGNIFLTCISSLNTDFDLGPGTYTLGNGMCVAKYSNTGILLWAKLIARMGTTEEINSIVTDLSGNCYFTGDFQTGTDFDPGPGTFTMSAGIGTNANIFVCKYDPNGNFVWAKKFGGTTVSEGNSITVDPFGDVCISGRFTGTVDFDPGPAAFNLSAAAFNTSAFVVKITSAGNFVWAKGFASNTESFAVKTDAAGNVYNVGYFCCTQDFDPSSSTFTLSTKGQMDSYIQKLSSTGVFMWAENIGGPLDEFAYALTIDASSNIIITGTYETGCDFDPGAATFTLGTAGLTDIFALKINSSGNFVWAKTMGSPSVDASYAIDSDNSGNIYCSGSIRAVADIDPGPATYTVPGGTNSASFISKLDASGNFITGYEITQPVLTAGGSVDIRSIKVDPIGNIFGFGEFNDKVDLMPGSGTYSFSVNANYPQDLFFLKIGSCSLPASPVNNTGTININICVGSQATLSATGTGTLNWYSTTSFIGSGNSIITPALTSTSSTFYVGDNNSCGQCLILTPVTVTAIPKPTVAVSASSTLICSGQTSTLSANGALTYSWTTSATGSSIVVSPTITTIYSVTGTDLNGCSNVASITQSVSACTGVNELEKLGFEIFPNPNNGEFSISLNNLNSNIYYEIYNTIGQIVKHERILHLKTKINLSEQANGLYFVKILEDNKPVYYYKIIKQ